MKAIKNSPTNIFLTMRQPVRHLSLCAATLDVYGHTSVIFKSCQRHGARRWPRRITSGCAFDPRSNKLDLLDCVLPKRTCPNKGGLIPFPRHTERERQRGSPLCLSLCVCHELCIIISWIIFHSWPNYLLCNKINTVSVTSLVTNDLFSLFGFFILVKSSLNCAPGITKWP